MSESLRHCDLPILHDSHGAGYSAGLNVEYDRYLANKRIVTLKIPFEFLLELVHKSLDLLSVTHLRSQYAVLVSKCKGKLFYHEHTPSATFSNFQYVIGRIPSRFPVIFTMRYFSGVPSAIREPTVKPSSKSG